MVLCLYQASWKLVMWLKIEACMHTHTQQGDLISLFFFLPLWRTVGKKTSQDIIWNWSVLQWWKVRLLLCHVAVQNGRSNLLLFCMVLEEPAASVSCTVEKKAVCFPKTVGNVYQSARCCNVYDLKHSHHTCGLKWGIYEILTAVFQPA
jgi:hypothetical protein